MAETPPLSTRARWLSRRAVIAHAALLIWIPGCAVAAWWQVGIALNGDSLGWVYSVMWPCFAVFGAIFWWFLVHDDPDSVGARGLRRQAAASAASPPSPGTDDAGAGSGGSSSDDGERLARAEAEDPELAEYNAYLATLAGQEKSWRRRS